MEVDVSEIGDPIIHTEVAELETGSCALEVDNYSAYYSVADEMRTALENVSMKIPISSVTALIGPSGCGKSTMLRSCNRMNDLITGFKFSGDIRMGDMSIHSPSLNVIEVRKRMGMVFQRPNPFPMSIFENVIYSLRIDGERNRQTLDETCEESLRRVSLWEEVKDRLTENALSLSGGQQQRLCIARAIAPGPEVLLMDEPCSALDPISTDAIEDLIKKLKKEQQTILIVTHNMHQAGRVSDNTAFLWNGKMVEYGKTKTVFQNPQSEHTEAFISGKARY